MALYAEMCRSHRYPLPTSVPSPIDIESLVLRAYITDQRWQLPRMPPRSIDISLSSETLDNLPSSPEDSAPHETMEGVLDMTVLSDRWLVVVRQSGVAEVWDLYPVSGKEGTGITRSWNKDSGCKPLRKARFNVQEPSTSIACMDQTNAAIILSVY